MKSKWTSNLAMLLAAIIWGFAFVAQVEGTKLLGSFTIIGFRFVIGITALLPVVLLFERGRTDKTERKTTLKASIITGIVLFCAQSFQQFGIRFNQSSGISGLITGLYMIFVPIVAMVLFKKKPGMQVWIGAIFAFGGLLLICYDPDKGISFGLAELLLLIGTFFWTAHIMLVDHFSKRLRCIHYSWGQFAVCALLGMIFAFTFEFDSISVEALMNAKWELLYLGVFSSGCAYTLQVLGQKHADPSYAVIILSTESAFSVIGGALFGTDTMTLIGYIGCAIMFFGLLYSQIDFKTILKKENKNTANN